jgi:hypothetical protein
LKDAAQTWFNSLSPGSLNSPIALVNAFFQKYFPASAQHAAVGKSLTLNREKERYCLNLGQGFIL